MEERRSHTRQLIASLLAGVAIVAIAVLAVTAAIGPTSVAELDALEERIEMQEDRLDQREDLQEERLEELEER